MSTQQDFTQCPHWGKGGRYIVDGNGQRIPAPDTGTPPSENPPAATDVAPVGEQPVSKGK